MIAGRTGRHNYTEWDQVLIGEGAAHPAMNPYNMPENRDCRRSYAKDMCQRSLDILNRTVMVPTHPLHTAQQIADTIHNIGVAARVALAGLPRARRTSGTSSRSTRRSSISRYRHLGRSRGAGITATTREEEQWTGLGKALQARSWRSGVVAAGAPAQATRIVVITHGQASDPFWSVVKNGVDDAGKLMGVEVQYQAPQTFDMVAMAQMIDAAVASKPDGLVVSIPDAEALGDSIRAAVAAGIPVISMDSGLDVSKELGALLHLGIDEYPSGFAAGEKMKASARPAAPASRWRSATSPSTSAARASPTRWAASRR